MKNSSLEELKDLKTKLADVMAKNKISELEPDQNTHFKVGALWFPKEEIVQQAKRAKTALMKLKGPYLHKIRWKHGTVPPQECEDLAQQVDWSGSTLEVMGNTLLATKKSMIAHKTIIRVVKEGQV